MPLRGKGNKTKAKLLGGTQIHDIVQLFKHSQDSVHGKTLVNVP